MTPYQQNQRSNGGGAAAPQREKVTFAINVPQVLTLEFNPPSDAREGRFGDQFMYFLGDNKIMWADPPLHEEILRSGAKAGSEIGICKRELRNGAAADPRRQRTHRRKSHGSGASRSHRSVRTGRLRCAPRRRARSRHHHFHQRDGGQKMTATETNTSEGRATRALSPSQVTTYTDCAARWWYGSAMGLEDPPTGALALGRAVHSTIALDLEAQKNGIGEATQDDLTQEFGMAWRGELETATLRADEDAATLEAKGAQLVWLFHTQVAHTLKPKFIEQAITAVIGTAHVRGVIDIVTEEGELIDIKTASKKPLGISAAHALQLTTYAIATGSKHTRVITLTKTKDPGLYSHTLEITPAHTHYAVTMFSMVADAIEAGIHLPNRGSTLCSRKQCAFWRSCQSDHGGHVRE